MNQLHELHKTYNSLIAKELIHSKHFLTKFENEQYGYTYKQKAMVDGVYTEYTDSNMTYEINSAGFRTKEFDTFKEIDLLLLGCSHTLGYGQPFKDTWGYLLADDLNIDHDKVCNLSIFGASPDMVITVASAFLCSNLPRPKLVAVMWPDSERQDVMIDNSIWVAQPWAPTVQNAIGDDRFESYLNWCCNNPHLEDACYHDKNIILCNIAEIMGAKYINLPFTHSLRKESLFSDKIGLDRARDYIHAGRSIQCYWKDLIKENYDVIRTK